MHLFQLQIKVDYQIFPLLTTAHDSAKLAYLINEIELIG